MPRFLLIFGFMLRFICPGWAQAPTFHAILVGATQDRTLALSCTADLINTDSKLKLIAGRLGYQYAGGVLAGKDFQLDAVAAAINRLTCQPSDVVFFYYSGHGANATQSNTEFPFLALEGKRYPALVEVHEALLAKKPRLCITVGDCCNNFVDQNPAATRSVVKGAQASRSILESLFVQSRGDLIVASSKPGQKSIGCPLGGLFTLSFLDALDYAVYYNRQVSWKALLDDVQTRLTQANASHQQDLIFKANLTDEPIEALIDTTAPALAVAPVESIPTPAPAAGPAASQQGPAYADINAFFNAQTDERRPSAERRGQWAEAARYFDPATRVRLFVNDTEVERLPLNEVLSRHVLLAAKIQQVNFIERFSTVGASGRYAEIAIQEIWHPSR